MELCARPKNGETNFPQLKSTNDFETRPLPPMKGGYSHTVDDIHSSIKFCPCIKALIDTPQVQRLRHLKQLGVSQYVYVNTTHTRFEHSLGVAHLAEQMLHSIKRRQPQLQITEKDVLCVKIAGLCHDLGHGPFSHVFDGEFRKRITNRSSIPTSANSFTKEYSSSMENHENASLRMLDEALLHLGLQIDTCPKKLDEPLKQVSNGISNRFFGVCGTTYDGKGSGLPSAQVLTSRDLIFVKECIVASPLEDVSTKFVGRPDKEKEFLYDIISNRHNGLDVDKIDYYARDKNRALGGSGDLDTKLINEAFICKGVCPRPEKCFQCRSCFGNKPQTHFMIAYPDKLVPHAMNFFKTRFRLHSKIYTHKTCKAAEFMICDILALADPYYLIPNGDAEEHDKIFTSEPKAVRISEAMSYPKAYLRLTDTIINSIHLSTDRNLSEARKIIDRLNARKLYKCVKIQPIRNSEKDNHFWTKYTEESLRQKIVSSHFVHNNENTFGRQTTLELHDIIVEKRVIHHGMKKDNPVNLMRFLSKHQLSRLHEPYEKLPDAYQPDEETYESHIPRVFLERTIRIFCRTSPEKGDLLRHVFEQIWLEEKEMGVTPAVYETPLRGIRTLSQESGGDYEGDGLVSSTPVVKESLWAFEEEEEEEEEEKKENGHKRKRPDATERKKKPKRLNMCDRDALGK